DAVRRMTSATADLYGLGDRGRLVSGMVGDVNVIDLDRLRLRRPERVEDLPGGAGRLVQRSEGYVATVKSGVVTVLDGVLTGEEPGRLLRGAR
ncbi:MAG: amidohydrolase family protein, partial [Actinobacteria bacterium]|nr:amidohydrolase family protein [Actinomycetota bacterium]